FGTASTPAPCLPPSCLPSPPAGTPRTPPRDPPGQCRLRCHSLTPRPTRPLAWPRGEPAVRDRGRPPRPGPRSLERAVERRRSRIQPSTGRRARSASAAASDLPSGCQPGRLLVPSERLRALLIGPDALDDEGRGTPRR